jgi:hypothetical protein
MMTHRNKKSQVRKSVMKIAMAVCNSKEIKKSVTKISVILLIISLNWAGLFAVMETIAYLNDTEDSVNNFTATLLDFSVTNRHIEDFIGIEALSDIEFASVVTKKTGSLDVQYEVKAEKIDGNDDFCNALELRAEHNGIEVHDGSLLSFTTATTFQLGTWEFEINLPASATNVFHGSECNVDLVLKGWRKDVPVFEDSGFTDEERIELRLTSRMIVLNEFLPNPEGLEYGFDFGTDSGTMPQGEWVELYNNSDSSLDLAGWYIGDEGTVNKVMIESTNTYPAGTTIGAKDWLVVYMNKEVLDNTGDTVKLFNQSDELVDSHAYTGNDYCDVEPTPGEENVSDTDGSCAGVPANKSYARIPDGLGYWVDPIPTPGRMNVLDGESVSINSAILQQTEEKVAEEPQPSLEATVGEAIVEEEAVEEPVIEEEPAVSESTSQDSVIEEPKVEESVTEEPSEESTTTEETVVTEEPVQTEEPTTEEEQPASEENSTQDVSSVLDEPIIFTVEEPVIEPEPILPPAPEPVPTETSGSAPTE